MSDAIKLEVEGLDVLLKKVNGLEKDLRAAANGEIRQAGMEAARVGISMLGGSGAPQERALLASLGPKRDRYPVISVVRKPALRGLRKTPADVAKKVPFWPVEMGSGYPPLHFPIKHAMIKSHVDEITNRVLPIYQRALTAILRKHSLL